MKKSLVLCLIIFLSLFTTSCNKDHGLKIGYTPGINGFNIPVTLCLGYGHIYFKYNGINISTPIGSFSIGNDEYITPHYTYIELINQQTSKKLVFELLKNESKFVAETNGETKIEVTEKRNSTIITISSKEITNYLCTQNHDTKLKPGFHHVIIPHWLIIKSLNIDWSINSFGDFITDVFFVILWVICAIIDFYLIVVDIILRVCFSIFENLWYFISSMFY